MVSIPSFYQAPIDSSITLQLFSFPYLSFTNWKLISPFFPLFPFSSCHLFFFCSTMPFSTLLLSFFHSLVFTPKVGTCVFPPHFIPSSTIYYSFIQKDSSHISNRKQVCRSNLWLLLKVMAFRALYHSLVSLLSLFWKGNYQDGKEAGY